MPKTILERIAAGDPGAVDQCLEQYRGLVWSMARRFTNDHADAEDAVQEIFIELWRHASRFDPSLAAESTFVATLARRRLIDRSRRRARRPEASSMVAEPAAVAPSEADRLEAVEEGRRVRGLLQQLRPEQRRVLELSFDHGLSQQEIAEATRLPLGTVKTHSRRGLIRLRELLEAAAAEDVSGKNGSMPRERAWS